MAYALKMFRSFSAEFNGFILCKIIVIIKERPLENYELKMNTYIERWFYPLSVPA
jgi:hypothetical protein